MTHALSTARRLIAAAALVLPPVAQADPVTYDAFLEGSGITVYDAVTGRGAWTGTLADAPFPVPDRQLSLLTVVSFSFDSTNNVLGGDFEFTSLDFTSTIVGLLSGSFLSGDADGGGQLFLNYDIRGGTGAFDRANGNLISLFEFTPSGGGFGTYTEAATGQFSVPEPSMAALSALGLVGVLVVGARRRAVPACSPGATRDR